MFIRHFRNGIYIGIHGYTLRLKVCDECPNDYLGFEIETRKYPYFSTKFERHCAETYIKIEGYKFKNFLTVFSSKTFDMHEIGFRLLGSNFKHFNLRNIRHAIRQAHKRVMFYEAIKKELRSLSYKSPKEVKN